MTVDRSTDTRISSGSSDCEAKALTVMPCIRPAAVVVMTVTPLAKWPMTWRKEALSGGGITPIRYGNVRRQSARLGGPEFQEGAYHLGVTGAPVLEEATAYLKATLDRTLEAGDHTIMVGRVVALKVVRDAAPLIYFRSRYRSLP